MDLKILPKEIEDIINDNVSSIIHKEKFQPCLDEIKKMTYKIFSENGLHLSRRNNSDNSYYYGIDLVEYYIRDGYTCLNIEQHININENNIGEIIYMTRIREDDKGCITVIDLY